MKKFILILALLLCAAGCDESQRQEVDRLAENTKTISEVGEGVLNSPVGAFVPAELQAWFRLAGLIAVIAAGGWQEFRRRKSETALKEVVAGVEATKTGINYRNAQNGAQSVGTQQKVAAIRKSLTI